MKIRIPVLCELLMNLERSTDAGLLITLALKNLCWKWDSPGHTTWERKSKWMQCLLLIGMTRSGTVIM